MKTGFTTSKMEVIPMQLGILPNLFGREPNVLGLEKLLENIKVWIAISLLQDIPLQAMLKDNFKQTFKSVFSLIRFYLTL